jgi:hypothetical protein
MTAALIALVTGLAGIVVLWLLRWRDTEAWRRSLVRYRLTLPGDLSVAEVAGWLGQLATITRPPRFSLLPALPVGIEIDASTEGITHTVLVPAEYEAAVLASLRSGLSRARVTVITDPETPVTFKWAAELRLTSFWRPLAEDRAETTARALLAMLQPLPSGTRIRLAYLLAGAHSHASPPNTVAFWQHLAGSTVPTSDAEKDYQRKTRQPLLVASLGVAVTAPSGQSSSLLHRITSTLRGMDTSGAAVVRRWLPGRIAGRRVTKRTMPLGSWPLVLNTIEAAGLVALSPGGVVLPGLPVGASRTVPPAVDMPTGGVVIGESTYPTGEPQPLTLLPNDRTRHVYILGPTGVGKSNLFSQMVLHDLDQGAGMLVIDPKADLIDAILARCPDHRRGDIYVLDPANLTDPGGINCLRVRGGEQQRELAAETTVNILRNIFRAYWGPRTDDIIRAAVTSLVQVPAPDGTAFTLCEISELLTSARLRQYVATHPRLDERWREYWQWYNGLTEGQRLEVIGPALNKLRALTTRISLKLMLGQSQGIDLNTIFTQRKVVLVPLQKGVIGTEAATLLGAFVVGAFWAATLAQASVPPQRRRFVAAYLDEFQNVVRFTDDVAEMLAEARALKVALHLAHQYHKQIPELTRAAVMGTVRTQIFFQLDYDGAKLIERRIAPVLTSADLMNLPQYEIVARLCVGGQTRPPVTGRTLPLPEPTQDPDALRTELAKASGMARADIEAGLRARRLATGQARLGELPVDVDEVEQ